MKLIWSTRFKLKTRFNICHHMQEEFCVILKEELIPVNLVH